MGKRFSRIRQAQRLEAALTHYDQWLVAAKPVKTGTPATKGKSTTLYVIPFNVDIGATELVPSSYIESTASDALKTEIGARVLSALTTGTHAVTLKNFKAARIQQVTPGASAPSYVPSKITGTQYIKYSKSTVSVPFGRTAVTTEEAEGTAFSSLKATVAVSPKKAYLIAEHFTAK